MTNETNDRSHRRRRHRQGSHPGGASPSIEAGGARARGARRSSSPSCPGAASTTAQHGRMMDEDGFDRLRDVRRHLSRRASAPRRCPDHISVWELILPIRQRFDQYVNLRPMRLLAGLTLAARQPRRRPTSTWSACARTPKASTPGVGGRLHRGTPHEVAQQTGVFTRHGIERIAALRASSWRRSGRASCSRAPPSRTRCSTRWCCGTRSPRSCRRTTRRSTSASTTSTRWPRGWSPHPADARRDRRVEPVRRHPHRHRLGDLGQPRHRAGREHQPGAALPVDVRADPRLGARHRRQGASPIRSARSGPAR